MGITKAMDLGLESGTVRLQGLKTPKASGQSLWGLVVDMGIAEGAGEETCMPGIEIGTEAAK